MKSKSVTRISKIKIDKSVIRSILIYECETYIHISMMTKAVEAKITCFEKTIHSKIYGHFHDQNTRQYRIRTNDETDLQYQRRCPENQIVVTEMG